MKNKTVSTLTNHIVKGVNRKEKFEIQPKECKKCGSKEDLEIHHEIYPQSSKDIKEAIKEGKIYYLCQVCHRNESKSNRINSVVEIRCKCGSIVTGNSKLHAEANLKNHEDSKKHKRNMKVLK